MDQTMRTRCPGNSQAYLDYNPPPALSQADRWRASTPEATAQGQRENDVEEPAVAGLFRAPDQLAATDKSPLTPASGNDVDAGASAEVEALREADRLKAELLGTVSHELRSPLAVIKGYAATLLRHEHNLEQAERREFLTDIALACDRLEVMVNQMLEMSQLEAGMLVPRLTLMSLEQLVREAASALEQRLAIGKFGEHRVVLDVQGTRRIPLVEADPRLLRDALDNVLENALKYSPSSGTISVTLQVAALPVAAPPGGKSVPVASARLDLAVVIGVRDTGIGIPAEHLERIFDSFHRVDTGLTREINGLGLGLAIVARIIGLHGGLIWGESNLGEGSTFYLALPAAQEEDEGASQNEMRST